MPATRRVPHIGNKAKDNLGGDEIKSRARRHRGGGNARTRHQAVGVGHGHRRLDGVDVVLPCLDEQRQLPRRPRRFRLHIQHRNNNNPPHVSGCNSVVLPLNVALAVAP